MDHDTLNAHRTTLYRLKLELIAHYAAGAGHTVRAGPFTGLRLPTNGHWGGGDHLSKVFGLYEAPLHGIFEDALALGYPLFVDVGCADGYYATGFALKSPRTRCFGYDLDGGAQRSAQAQVIENGLANCRIRGAFVAGALTALRAECRVPETARVLVKCDIEGAELELFNADFCAELTHCDVLIELHDYRDDTRIEEALRARLNPSHRLTTVCEGPRNANAHAFLRDLPEDVRWLVTSESRWSAMRWLWATSRAT
ncbi:MAG: hypothetical protein ACKOBM_15135 [Gammaproteobacteria bacterium]